MAKTPETCADLRKLLESTVYAATLEGSMTDLSATQQIKELRERVARLVRDRDKALTMVADQGAKYREEIAYLRSVAVKGHVHTGNCAHKIGPMEVEGASECSHCGPHYGATEFCGNRCDVVQIEYADEMKRLELFKLVNEGGTV